MQDELLDQVDENDTIIGEVTRSQAHQNPSLIHREIVVILTNEKNEILMQQRSRSKETYPLQWDISVAGHVPKGLEPEAQAHKELKEELDWEGKIVFVEKRLFKTVIQTAQESHILYLFLGRCDEITEIHWNKEEIEQVMYMSLKEAHKAYMNNAQDPYLSETWAWYESILKTSIDSSH